MATTVSELARREIPDPQMVRPGQAAVRTAPSSGLAAVADRTGQTHVIEATRSVADLVAFLNQQPEAIGVMVLVEGRFATALSREAVARLLSKPYTQFLYLHRPISHLLTSWTDHPLECALTDPIADVIGRALSRPASQRYDLVVTTDASGRRHMLDVHDLLLEQTPGQYRPPAVSAQALR